MKKGIRLSLGDIVVRSLRCDFVSQIVFVFRMLQYPVTRNRFQWRQDLMRLYLLPGGAKKLSDFFFAGIEQIYSNPKISIHAPSAANITAAAILTHFIGIH